MTYRELKELKKKIKSQRLAVAVARAEAASMSSASDGLPHGCGVCDRVGSSTVRLVAEKEKLDGLYNQLAESIRAIPDEYMRNLIRLRVNGLSWTKIAVEVGGGNTEDGVRKTVERYSW